jgi:hypothetical protein
VTHKIKTTNFGGAFPVWIAPEQIAAIPVAESFNEYAQKVAAELRQCDFRMSAELDPNFITILRAFVIIRAVMPFCPLSLRESLVYATKIDKAT